MKSPIHKKPGMIHQGGNLAFFRNKRGWSQKYVAEISGINQQQISEIETSVELSEDIIKKLSQVYGLDQFWITEVDMVEIPESTYYDQHGNQYVVNNGNVVINESNPEERDKAFAAIRQLHLDTISWLQESHTKKIEDLKSIYEERLNQLTT